MSDYLTDFEQVERVKRWIRTYAWPVIIGMAIALAGNWGWNYWQQQKQMQREFAANSYVQFLDHLHTQSLSNLVEQAQAIFTEYSATPYASLVAALVAERAVEGEEYQIALNHLQWGIKHARDELLRQLMLIRAARIHLVLNQPEKALDLLDEVSHDKFQAYQLEVKADAFNALGKIAEAHSLYQQAINALPQGTNHFLLELKLAEASIQQTQNQ